MRKQDETIEITITLEELWALRALIGGTSVSEMREILRCVDADKVARATDVALYNKLRVSCESFELVQSYDGSFPNKNQKALDQIAELQAQVEELKKTITD
jgi:DNA-binding transcriptional MerR regulator